jgi:hypothetical protein
MSDPLPPTVAPISWVKKRDGSLDPFEADKISRSLFGASEELGQADAFLCRELTDGVLHFMAQEFSGQTPTTAAVRDLVIKVVRELGQPALAQKYQEGKTKAPPPAGQRASTSGLKQLEWMARWLGQRISSGTGATERPLEDYLTSHFALSQVFAPDLLAVQADGLIDLGSVRSCRGLTAAVVPHQSEPLDLIESMASYRRATGDVLIVDSPDQQPGLPQAYFATWRRAFQLGLGDQGCRAIVNLHRATISQDRADPFFGSLFTPATPELPATESGNRALALCDELLKHATGLIRIDWHQSEDDFNVGQRALINAVAHRAAAGQPICFVFDRPKRSPRLAEGVHSQQRAVLMEIGLHLPQLAKQMGLPRSPERFLTKLISLVRLALAAATQKRSLLRRLREENSVLARGFFLEKARVILVPIGLEAVVREFTGEAICSRSAASLNFACQILQGIRTTLHNDGKALLLDAVVDSSLAEDRSSSGLVQSEPAPLLERIAGVTVWDDQAPLTRQLGVCGSLHEAALGGTAFIPTVIANAGAIGDLVDALEHVWKKTNLLALRFVPENKQAEKEKGRSFLDD